MAREAEVAIQKAWTLVEGGHADEALAIFDRVIGQSPGDAGLRLERGVALFKLKRLEAALGAFDDVLALEPGHVVALNNRGKMQRLLGRDEAARETFERALALADTLKTRLALADALDAVGRRDEALAHAEEAARREPRDPLVHHARGVVLWHMERLAEARAAFEQALALKADHFESLRDRGHALAAAGDRQGARESLAAAIKQHPKDVVVILDLAALCLPEQPRDALALAERALTLDRESARAWRTKGRAQAELGQHASASLNAGVAAMIEGDLEGALVHLDAALARDARYAQAWSNKGVVLNRLARYEDALAAYDQALALDPKAIPIWHNKGMLLYHKLGRPADGVRCFKEEVRLDPKRWFELPSEIRLQVDQLR